MSYLQIQNVQKSFGSTKAVDGVSLTLDQGEIVCLLGPSGCGKTTLLRLVAGLESADSGSIVLGGRDLVDVPTYQRGIGMMFQSYALFPHMTVAENIGYGLRMAKEAQSLIGERVAEMLALVDLEGLENRKVDQLSGGQQQRVALARSLATRPGILLLDEPLGSLDRLLRERLLDELRSILKKVGVTALYVTHDQAEAFGIGDRVAVMNRGKIEQIASPQEIYTRPETRFVASFLGLGNLVESGKLLITLDSKGHSSLDSSLNPHPRAAHNPSPSLGRGADHPSPSGEGAPLGADEGVEFVEEPANLRQIFYQARTAGANWLLIPPYAASTKGRDGLQRVQAVVNNHSFRGRFMMLNCQVGEQELEFSLDPYGVEGLIGRNFEAGEQIELWLNPQQFVMLSE
ncbi:MAG: ABC transporter ATP-binding protein [Chloroflexota bacterium]